MAEESKTTAAPSAAEKAKGMLPNAGHAVVGTSLIVLLVELARSGALAQYHEFLAPLISWGPGLLIVAGQIWTVAKFAPLFIESQNKVAGSLASLASSVQTTAVAVQQTREEQRETIFTLQLLSKKVEEMKADAREIADEYSKKIDELKSDVSDLRESNERGPKAAH